MIIDPISPVLKMTVTVKADWPSKNAKRRIPTELELLGKMLLRETFEEQQTFEAEEQSVHLPQKEIEKGVSQPLDKDSMTTFSMEKLHDEI